MFPTWQQDGWLDVCVLDNNIKSSAGARIGGESYIYIFGSHIHLYYVS